MVFLLALWCRCAASAQVEDGAMCSWILEVSEGGAAVLLDPAHLLCMTYLAGAALVVMAPRLNLAIYFRKYI